MLSVTTGPAFWPLRLNGCAGTRISQALSELCPEGALGLVCERAASTLLLLPEGHRHSDPRDLMSVPVNDLQADDEASSSHLHSTLVIVAEAGSHPTQLPALVSDDPTHGQN